MAFLTRSSQHSMDLVLDTSLPNAPPYHLSPNEATMIERQLHALLESVHIQPSMSPFGSNAFVIPKKDSKEMHLVIDYALSKVTIKNHYLLL